MAATTYDMERPAVMPAVAPVHVACHTGQLAAELTARQEQYAFTRAIAGKPWTTGFDRSRGLLGLLNGRSARHLGSIST